MDFECSLSQSINVQTADFKWTISLVSCQLYCYIIVSYYLSKNMVRGTRCSSAISAALAGREEVRKERAWGVKETARGYQAVVETRVLGAVDLRQLLLPPKCNHYTSSYPNHQFRIGWHSQALLFPKPWWGHDIQKKKFKGEPNLYEVVVTWPPSSIPSDVIEKWTMSFISKNQQKSPKIMKKNQNNEKSGENFHE